MSRTLAPAEEPSRLAEPLAEPVALPKGGWMYVRPGRAPRSPAGGRPAEDRLVLRYGWAERAGGLPAHGVCAPAAAVCAITLGLPSDPGAGPIAEPVVELHLNLAALAPSAACGGDGGLEMARLGEIKLLYAASPVAVVLSDILGCDMAPCLRRPYLAAKGIELACLTLDEALRRAEPCGDAAPGRRADLAKTERARDILLQELAAPARLERLARRVGLNRSKLAACFKFLYGCGVYEFSRRERLRAAARLLAETEASVMQIAAATGYETLASFSKSFSAEFGVSPRGWRASSAVPEGRRHQLAG